MGQLGERARRENASFPALVARESERVRVALARCKNAATLRETVVDLWSRAGSIPELREQWAAILPLFDEANWKKAKDLALLALASYSPKSPEEEDAIDEAAQSTDEGETE